MLCTSNTNQLQCIVHTYIVSILLKIVVLASMHTKYEVKPELNKIRKNEKKIASN